MQRGTSPESLHHRQHRVEAASCHCLRPLPKQPAGVGALDLAEPAPAEGRFHSVPRQLQLCDPPDERLRNSGSPGGNSSMQGLRPLG